MNPQIIATIEQCLARGFSTLVLTNAMRPMMKLAAPLLELRQRFGERLVLRVSLDHYRSELHEQERGKHTWLPTMRGMHWLANNGFQVHVAGRLRWGDAEPEMRLGYAALFGREQIGIDAQDPGQLVLFPEMDESAVVPEITTDCWAILHKEPGEVMCASARMVLKRKGQARASVVACTLLPHSAGFDTGPELADALGPVKLNHPHCAKFCVLGGGRCSG